MCFSVLQQRIGEQLHIQLHKSQLSTAGVYKGPTHCRLLGQLLRTSACNATMAATGLMQPNGILTRSRPAAQLRTSAPVTVHAPCRHRQQRTARPQAAFGAAATAAATRQQRLAGRSWNSRRHVLLAAATEGSAAGESAPEPLPLEEDFDLLSNSVAELTKQLDAELKGCSIYLVGMMGSGKSTVGRMLANTLKYAFFDTDNVIELAHNKQSVSELWKEHGEEYFRNCESQVLRELAPYKNLVVSTGGGAVTRPKNWSHMHNGIVAWLQGDPALLARRVVAQGPETRPLVYDQDVKEEDLYNYTYNKISSLLEQRTKYYVNADIVVPLEGTGADAETGAPSAVVMHRLLKAVLARIQETKEEREAKRNFTIEYADTGVQKTQGGQQTAEE